MQGNPSAGELNTRGVAKYSDFGPIDGYISEKVQYTCTSVRPQKVFPISI